MGIAMDDFSFPQVADDESVKLISPSLWRISSLVFPECNHYKEEGDMSSNSMHSLRIKNSGSEEDDDTNSMHSLWIENSSSEEYYDTRSMHNLQMKSSGSEEDDDDTHSMHNLRIKDSGSVVEEEDDDTHSMHNLRIKNSGSEEDYDRNRMHNLRIKNSGSEEEDDTNSMHNLQIRSSGSGAEEKMDTLWEDMNDYDFHSKHLLINEAIVQSSRTNHHESLKKSKINTVVIKVTKKLFSLRIMAGAKK